jgi:hypothetical protein
MQILRRRRHAAAGRQSVKDSCHCNANTAGAAESKFLRSIKGISPANNLFVSLVYCAESTVRWFVVREKHCWMAADSADKFKRTGCKAVFTSFKIPKILQDSPSHRIFERMHGVLNVGKKITNYIVCL